MLEGQLPIEDYLLQQDLEYPAFSLQQNKLLQQFFQQGKKLRQVEPFLDVLLEIHGFFTDGNSPKDLPRPSVLFDVYSREKDATAKLIQYYIAVKSDNFSSILESIKKFAQADAERFRLRDTMRAKSITSCIQKHNSIYIEAGQMHILLEKLIKQNIPKEWTMQTINIEQLLLKELGITGNVFSPGDELTANYLLQNGLPLEHEDLLSARSLIYAKIVTKEEMTDPSSLYAHTQNEYEVINLVNHLSIEDCEKLFFEIRELNTEAAKTHVDYFSQENQNK